MGASKARPMGSDYSGLLSTKLENGILTKTFNDSKRECAYRCILTVNARHLRYSEWIEIENGTKPECDIVETKCFPMTSKEKPDFEYLHAQIYRKDTKPKTGSTQVPSVHIIIIDSMSHSSLLRAMPKTVETLKLDFGAIPFPHLNKIGINSRPNGFGFLLGKQIRNISKSPISVGYRSDYKNHDETCFKPLDDDQHVFSLFKASGYKNVYLEDWFADVFTYPNCTGFARYEMDHTMKPFFLRLGLDLRRRGYDSTTIRKSVQKGYKIDEILIPQLERFLDAYPDHPKFSLTWNTYMAHDENNNLFQADALFNDFFTRNKKKFHNSFIFFMGDHGMRFGDIRRTMIGELEDSNPALMVVLPETIRKNSELVDTVVQNSEQLISHYDLFATFVDIANAKHNNGKELVLHGSSILQTLPQPRTCDRLRIPIEFCTCIYPKLSQSTTSVNAESQLIASKLVENINKVIEADKLLHHICVPLMLNLNTSILVDEFQADNNYTVYFVTFNANPGNGSYRAYAGRQKDDNFTTYPQLAPIFETESVFGYDSETNMWIVYFFAVVIVMIGLIIPLTEFLCSVLTLRKLRKIRQHISAHTFKLHKNLIIVLIIQITLPNVMILAPTVVVVLAAWLQWPYNNIIAEGTLMLCSFHSVIDNLIMLIAITPYRRTLKRIIVRRTLKVSIDRSLNVDPKSTLNVRSTHYRTMSTVASNSFYQQRTQSRRPSNRQF
uniref:Sulfatase domain-containing protein n=1 Tax=Panagrellus redivivus TaxID=6233 RepID=A0A7E4URI1_PANRE